MKKNKIEVGQCYEKNDRIFEVISGPYKAKITKNSKQVWWGVQWRMSSSPMNTAIVEEKELLRCRRPFTNCG